MPGIDEGDILDYQIFEIRETDTCETLYYKVSVVVKYMLSRTIPKLLNGDLVPTKQVGMPSYFSKRVPEDGEIDWTTSVFDIYNLIRAVTFPYPGAFTFYKGKKIMIWAAQVWDTMLDFYKDKEYGEVVEIFNDKYVVKCYDGLLLITASEDAEVFEGKTYTNGKYDDLLFL